ncbi:MAG TPA: phosphate ABC transporter substrate-binding protein PstS [Planctomycetota bacterium]|nr:phosphate ABC transporter substrate-binding protein PstS [Planctomycetota bacterium]
MRNGMTSAAKMAQMLVAICAFALVGGTATAEDTLSLNGAGATFPYPLYTKWFSEYQKTHSGVQFNYQSIGSGGGIKQVTEGTVDFGASDGPMTEAQLATFKEKRGVGIIHLPMCLGAVVPTYNIAGVTDELNFTPEAISGIFLGTVTKWNDKALAEANPGVKLPDADIVVVHRADGSGTSYCFTDYLSKVNADGKAKVGCGTSVKWPVGLGGKGNEGVAGLVKQTPNSIGYVELIYAVQNKMSFGKVKNAAGKFIKADLAATSAAAAGTAANMPEDFRVSITNAPGDTTYPISTFTWLLIPEKINDAAKKKAIVDFLKWSMAAGQDLNEPLSYARVPKEVIEKELKAIETIK